MSSIYTRVYEFYGDFHIVGFPLILRAGAITKNTETGEVFVQARFMNIGKKHIKAFKIKVILYDGTGNLLENSEEYQYLDLAVAQGAEFGGKVPIYISEKNARSFEIRPVEIAFSDGTVDSEISGEWTKIPERVPLAIVLPDYVLLKQYQLDYGTESMYECVEFEDLVLCSCGAIGMKKDGICHECLNEYMLFSDVDLDDLQKRANERITIEEVNSAEAVRLRLEWERQEKEDAKTRIIVGTIAVGVVIIIALLSILA